MSGNNIGDSTLRDFSPGVESWPDVRTCYNNKNWLAEPGAIDTTGIRSLVG